MVATLGAQTLFAPAERAAPDLLHRQVHQVAGHALTAALLEAMGGVVLVLNAQRQIVAVNRTLLMTVGVDVPEGVLGQRLGETLECRHVFSTPSGCGTGEACRSCGAVLATLACQEHDAAVERECVLTPAREDVGTLAFRARCAPLRLDDACYSVLTLQDIRREKRLDELQQLFFHDLLNVLQGLGGLCEALPSAGNGERQNMLRTLQHVTAQLGEMVLAQRDLHRMEQGSYRTRRERISVDEVVARLRAVFDSESRSARLAWPAPMGATLVTDPPVLLRALGNVLRNALEASRDDDKVQLEVEPGPLHVCFAVWSAPPIAPSVALRVFERHYSTKGGGGRGLGCYAAKLMVERTLGGALWFETGDAGTSFYLRVPVDDRATT
ncbi:MAG: ATP-binding protein [Pseudomonadota bacterium]